jgi:uncharacterized protein YjaZ
MNVIDTYEVVKNLFIQKEFDQTVWRTYINSISKGLANILENDSSHYDYDKEILPTITNALTNENKMEILHQSFVNVTKHLQERIVAVFNTDIEVDIILYLGLCNGAGWATEINGRKTILLGMEKIVELDWCNESNMIALIYHELGHIWHYSKRVVSKKIVEQKYKNIWQLYTEGVAMHCEQLLCENPRYFHQDKDNWLNWCDNNKDMLIAEYKKRINNNESVKEFFGDWNKFLDHTDLGYYIGSEFIKYLAIKYSLYEIA